MEVVLQLQRMTWDGRLGLSGSKAQRSEPLWLPWLQSMEVTDGASRIRSVRRDVVKVSSQLEVQAP